MSSAFLLSSPLAEFLSASHERAPSGIGVHLSECPVSAQLVLRGRVEDPEFLKGVQRVLGISIPLRPNTYEENNRHATLWLGPDEWLVITPTATDADTAQELRFALQGTPSAITDVSHGQTIIRIRGDRALDVLRKGCSLDLHPSVFGPGRCAQTLVAKAAIAIRWVDRSPSFDLIVRRSFAEYLALWLKDSAREYGLAVSCDERGKDSLTLGARKQHV